MCHRNTEVQLPEAALEEMSKDFPIFAPNILTMFEVLPKDLIRLLMYQYFDTISAIRCLRVCRLFHRVLGNTEAFVKQSMQKDCWCGYNDCVTRRRCKYSRLMAPFFDSCSFQGCDKKITYHERTCPAKMCKWCLFSFHDPIVRGNHRDPYHPQGCPLAEKALRLS
jgi:hypothetical protein